MKAWRNSEGREFPAVYCRDQWLAVVLTDRTQPQAIMESLGYELVEVDETVLPVSDSATQAGSADARSSGNQCRITREQCLERCKSYMGFDPTNPGGPYPRLVQKIVECNECAACVGWKLEFDRIEYADAGSTQAEAFTPKRMFRALVEADRHFDRLGDDPGNWTDLQNLNDWCVEYSNQCHKNRGPIPNPYDSPKAEPEEFEVVASPAVMSFNCGRIESDRLIPGKTYVVRLKEVE